MINTDSYITLISTVTVFLNNIRQFHLRQMENLRNELVIMNNKLCISSVFCTHLYLNHQQCTNETLHMYLSKVYQDKVETHSLKQTNKAQSIKQLFLPLFFSYIVSHKFGFA